MTLRQAVDEVLGTLTGLDLSYVPEMDRFQAITRALNKATRLNALEHEWSYYSSTESLGSLAVDTTEVTLLDTQRARVIGDDSVRFNDEDGVTWRWAYILPRDALHKYRARAGLWCALTRTTLEFSRPISNGEASLEAFLPVMREPTMFVLPEPATVDDPNPEVDEEILDQEIDFQYPDVICMRAAFLYAQTDPVMQPRVQTIEAQYKDLMYQVIERDDRVTDVPYLNEWMVPVQNGLATPAHPTWHLHPHADERRR
jgi:hypothetical protein